MIGWLNDWVIWWFDDWMIGWMDDWMIGWLDDWMIGWLDDWMIGFLDSWMIGWLDDWMIDWLDDWMMRWLDYWVTGWLDDWIIGWLDYWMIGCLGDWTIGWLNSWMIGLGLGYLGVFGWTVSSNCLLPAARRHASTPPQWNFRIRTRRNRKYSQVCCVRIHSDATNKHEKSMAGIVEYYQDLGPLGLGQLERQTNLSAF